MKANAALLWDQPGEFKLQEVELDEPGHGEVLVELKASGLCHSDYHFVTGDTPLDRFPYCAGHEGGGIVRQVGPGVTALKEGDHIVTTFVPSCGRCKWCAMGMQNLCDYGALILEGTQLDGSYRMHVEGRDIATAAMLGTFADWQVMDQASCVKVRDDVPLDVACLVGCGVPTGFGSAARAAGINPGDVVVISGVGGVGMNAVQGAKAAGARRIIIVDPAPFKREMAPTFGATDVFDNMADAIALAKSLTNGQGADSAIVTVGVITGQDITDGFNAIRKAGTVAVTGQGTMGVHPVDIDLFEISMYQKRIQGVLYGTGSPQEIIPTLLDMYVEGDLKLDELVTQRYSLDQINDAYQDMVDGKNIRGVIQYS